ncbi:sodium:proton antiporter [Subtercola sp. Z020]|uniref:cation:proton antiporter n=1 Tax=Subtercola sp. Z020 TaxID=2080582 RepID=UPI001E447128|nr:sodium:proton antiporter [Subtercola sp. Z020]
MELLIAGVLTLLGIAAAALIGPKVRIASPLVLVALGIGVSFLPFVPAFQVEPELILAGVLPPLLYSASVSMPAMNFRREFAAISGLSIVLVIASAVVLGLFFAWVIPGLGLWWGIALGAIVSPTDAVATSIVKRSPVSPRAVAILEGESLLNDATALVLLRTAIAGAAAAVSLWGTLGEFVFAVAVAVMLGFAVGRLNLFVRARLQNVTVGTVLSFTVPFLASIPAELLGASGLVAAVVAGLVTGRLAPRMLSPQSRLSDAQNWNTVEMVLEGAVFLLMGLELSSIFADVGSERIGVGPTLLIALGALLLTVLVRAAYVAPLLRGLKRRSARSERLKPRLAKMQEVLADPAAAAERASGFLEQMRAARGDPARPRELPASYGVAAANAAPAGVAGVDAAADGAVDPHAVEADAARVDSARVAPADTVDAATHADAAAGVAPAATVAEAARESHDAHEADEAEGTGQPGGGWGPGEIVGGPGLGRTGRRSGTGREARAGHADRDLHTHSAGRDHSTGRDLRVQSDADRALRADLSERAKLRLRRRLRRRRPPTVADMARFTTRITRTLADIDYLVQAPLGWREGVVVVWAGMRGAVTVAAAQTLPDGTPFRSLLVLIAFVVAALSLLIQGGTLPLVIRLLKLTPPDPALADEERARLFALLDETTVDDHPEAASSTTTTSGSSDDVPDDADARDDADALDDDADGDAAAVDPSSAAVAADDPDPAAAAARTPKQETLALIAARRTVLLDARDDGTFNADTLDAALSALDAEQIALQLQGNPTA